MEFDNARVLISDQKIETIKDIIPVLEKISQLNAPLLIITEDITGELILPTPSCIPATHSTPCIITLISRISRAASCMNQ